MTTPADNLYQYDNSDSRTSITERRTRRFWTQTTAMALVVASTVLSSVSFAVPTALCIEDYAAVPMSGLTSIPTATANVGMIRAFVPVIPEPASWLLLLSALSLLGARRRAA